MASSTVLIAYDSPVVFEYFEDLYDRQGTGEKYDSGSYLMKSASVRDAYVHSMETKMSAWEVEADGSNVVTAQLEVSSNLHDLNSLAQVDWEHTDPGFGMWLQAKIGQSNQILDKIEREHPELKPHDSKHYTADLLIRSDSQRNVFLASMQKNIDTWNVQKHKDPKGTHDDLVRMSNWYESIADGANWQKIDSDFAKRMNRHIENIAGLRREIERAHPELK